MKTINCLGMLCPMPIVELAKAVSEMKAGESVTLFADDPATEADLRAWTRMTGNQMQLIRANEFLIVKAEVH